MEEKKKGAVSIKRGDATAPIVHLDHRARNRGGIHHGGNLSTHLSLKKGLGKKEEEDSSTKICPLCEGELGGKIVTIEAGTLSVEGGGGTWRAGSKFHHRGGLANCLEKRKKERLG